MCACVRMEGDVVYTIVLYLSNFEKEGKGRDYKIEREQKKRKK